MGALSDKLKNRKMFISVGYILWGIVTAENMFLWAGIMCIFALPPLYLLIKKGFDIKEGKTTEDEIVA